MNKLIAVAALLVGCAHAPERKPVVWPDPPDPPRIRFVTAFRSTEDLDTGGWARFKRKLIGGGHDPGLAQPMGVALSEDGQRLYIADYGQNHVLVADFVKKSVRFFAPEENMGKPFNVALDADENVYVSDPVGKQVFVFDKKGEKLRVIARELDRPTGLAIDRARRTLYVADGGHRKNDNHRVRAYDLDGKVKFDLGVDGKPGGKGDADGQFHFPSYMTIDKNGNVYVADTMNFRIQVFGADGRFLRKYGDNGDTGGFFSRLKGLAFDGFGNLYAVDGGHSNVQIFNRDFQALMFFGGYAQKLEYFDIPSGIAIDPATNRIYICNEYVSRINVYELIGTRAEDSFPSTKPAPTASR